LKLFFEIESKGPSFKTKTAILIQESNLHDPNYENMRSLETKTREIQAWLCTIKTRRRPVYWSAIQYARNDRVEQKENKEAITMPPA